MGCNASEGIDDFYHYYSCPVLQAATAGLGLDFVPVGESLLRHFLLLEGTTQCQLRMALLHAAMTSVHLLRGGFDHVSHPHRGRHIRGIFKDTLSRNHKLRNTFNLMWQARGIQNAL